MVDGQSVLFLSVDRNKRSIAIDLQMETFICYLNGPQVRQNSCFVTIPGATGTPIMLVAHPIRYDGEAPHIRLSPQPLGAQTEEILKEAGYSDAEIADLEREGIVYCHHPGRPRQPSQKVKRKR
jgi:crotonobetainyl-CoA:carnitine CoA-transferase CaiB-like acyl-CoA transferase